MERARLIKISRVGPLGTWHNDYVGKTFEGVLDETSTEFKLDIEGGCWIDKKYVDIKTSASSTWYSGVKYRHEEETVLPPEEPKNVEDPIVSNPLLMSMIETYNKCFSTAVAKNNDYGGSNSDPFANFRNSTIAGVSVEKGILVRLMDKMSRISTLLDKEAMVKDEKITDTIEDAINYLAIMKAYINLKNQ
jgi:hypothetical protein